jgi:hypothetical protein
VGHGVGQYQVWVVGSQLDDVESAYCALSADERFTIGAVADLAKDDIESLAGFWLCECTIIPPCMPFAMLSLIRCSGGQHRNGTEIRLR